MAGRILDIDDTTIEPEQLRLLDFGMDVNMELGENQFVPVCLSLEKETFKYYIVLFQQMDTMNKYNKVKHFTKTNIF